MRLFPQLALFVNSWPVFALYQQHFPLISYHTMPRFKQKLEKMFPGIFMEIAAPNLAVLSRICYLRNAGNLLVVSTKLGHVQNMISDRISTPRA